MSDWVGNLEIHISHIVAYTCMFIFSLDETEELKESFFKAKEEMERLKEERFVTQYKILKWLK